MMSYDGNVLYINNNTHCILLYICGKSGKRNRNSCCAYHITRDKQCYATQIMTGYRLYYSILCIR